MWKLEKTSWKIAENTRFIKEFHELGLLWEVPQELFEVIEEFVCTTYSFCCSSVKKVRGKMFSKRLLQQRRPPDLPLLRTVLKYHVLSSICRQIMTIYVIVGDRGSRGHWFWLDYRRKTNRNWCSLSWRYYWATPQQTCWYRDEWGIRR